MQLTRDYYNNIEAPQFILAKGNGEKIGEIDCIEKKVTINLSEPNELHFLVYRLVDGIENVLYDNIEEMQYVLISGKGMYIITDVSEEDDGVNSKKNVTAKSEEYNLGQRYIEKIYINSVNEEYDYGFNNVVLYDPTSLEHSLLDIVLHDKCPDWSVGYVDPDLAVMQRTFEIDRNDVYSFLTNEMSEAFDAIVKFNTLERTINVYKNDTFGKDTSIFVSYDNLLKNVSLSSSVDDIKTSLTFAGADDIEYIRKINLGMDILYNLDYYMTDKFISRNLQHRYQEWKDQIDLIRYDYNRLVDQYFMLLHEKNYLENEKMPEDPEDTDWTKYGLKPLQEQLAKREKKQAVMIKAGQAEPTHPDYQYIYLPLYNQIQAINSQILVIYGDLEGIQSAIDLVVGIHPIGDPTHWIPDSLNYYADIVAMDKFFTEEQLTEMYRFIREDEFNYEYFILTDTMSDDEKYNMLKETLESAQKKINEVSQPQVQFSADMVNLLNMPEFDDISDGFEVGNYIHIMFRDDYILNVKLITIEFDFNDMTNISLTFSNLNKLKDKTIFSDISTAINASTSASTTVRANSSDWDSAKKKVDDIDVLMSAGYLSSGVPIKTSSNDVTIDDRGIIVKTNIITDPNDPNYDPNYDPADLNRCMIIGGSRIIFSDDNFETTQEAIGSFDYKEYDFDTHTWIDKTKYGVKAEAVVSGYINGSTIVVGGEDDGQIIMFDSNGVESGWWDKSGLHLPSGTVLPSDTTISYHNVSGAPTKLSEFTNDTNFVTETYVNNSVANLRVKTYTSTNNSSISISNGETKAIGTISITPTIETTIMMNIEIQINVETDTDTIDDDTSFYDCLVQAKYYLDGSPLTGMQPKEQYQDGYHILHLVYPLHLAQLQSHTFEVRIQSTHGTVSVAQNNVLIIANGQGLA